MVLFKVSIFFSSICAFACSNVILSSTNSSAIELIKPILPFSKLLCIASSISDTLIPGLLYVSISSVITAFF